MGLLAIINPWKAIHGSGGNYLMLYLPVTLIVLNTRNRFGTSYKLTQNLKYLPFKLVTIDDPRHTRPIFRNVEMLVSHGHTTRTAATFHLENPTELKTWD